MMFRQLKKIIKEELKDITDLAFEVIPTDKIFPHAVMTIAMNYYNQGLSNLQLDIDCWDMGTSTERIDQLAEQIIEKLKGFRYRDKNTSIVIYFSSSGYVRDSNVEIKRRLCTFEVQIRKG